MKFFEKITDPLPQRFHWQALSTEVCMEQIGPNQAWSHSGVNLERHCQAGGMQPKHFFCQNPNQPAGYLRLWSCQSRLALSASLRSFQKKIEIFET